MAPRASSQTDPTERVLGQLQAQVESMAESLHHIVQAAREATERASDERHALMEQITALRHDNIETKRELAGARADIAAMKPLHDRLQKSGWIMTGLLIGAGTIGGAVGM